MRAAFVIRLGAGTEAGQCHLVGWIEEVDTARAIRFQSTAELLQFLVKCFEESARSNEEGEFLMNTSEQSEERVLHVLGETVRIRLKSQQTQGAFALICSDTPPLGGVPPHVHSKEDETFIVLEGTYEFRVGDSVIQGQPGTCLFAPRGIPHSYQNVGQNSARLIVVFSPPGFEEYFEDIDAASSAHPPSFEEIVTLAQKYGAEPAQPTTNLRDTMSEMASRTGKAS